MRDKKAIYNSKFLSIFLLAPNAYEIAWTKDTRSITLEEYNVEIDNIVDFCKNNEVHRILFNFQDLILDMILFENVRPFVYLKEICKNQFLERGVMILPKDLLTHIVLKRFLMEGGLKKVKIFVNYNDALNWIVNE